MSKTTPKDLAKKRNDEKLLVSEMNALYCRKQHHSPKGKLCPECQQLHDYALARIEHSEYDCYFAHKEEPLFQFWLVYSNFYLQEIALPDIRQSNLVRHF